MNKFVAVGRTTKDCDIRSTSTGKQVASFTLAVDRDFKNAQGEKEADFLPCVVWGKLADVCEKYVIKGKQIAIAGRIQTRNYEDKDGQRRYITEVIVSDLQLLGSRQDAQQPQEPEFREMEEVDNSDSLPF